MELLLISENKLKITLSECDMRQYELDCNTIDYDNTETRRAFWSILDEAKHKTGFDAASQRVFIQLYPSKEGGCEMYVTKLGIHTSAPLDDPPKRSYKLLPLTQRELAYSFDTLDMLIGVCRRLCSIGFSGVSEAFRTHTGRYILIIDEPEENAYISLNEHSFIGEYGKRENLKSVRLMTDEHAECLCEKNAVELLAVL